MNIFLLNLLLAVIWAALWGSFTLVQLTTGFFLGFAILWLTQQGCAEDVVARFVPKAEA